MLIGVPAESMAGETRVAATPETVKKLKAQGHTLRIESHAGVAASVPDAAYEAAGAEITDAAGAWGADLVLKVRCPSESETPRLRAGATVVGMLNPFDATGLQRLAAAGVTAYALEAAPRTTRAQSMDVLSSQANIAGYKAVILAANEYGRFMPMLMTAAGTVKAARVLILGIDVLTAVIFATSLHFIMGPGGMHSFGHAAYFGLGAYGAALLVKWVAVPMGLALVAAPLVALAGALLFGWFAVRLSGVYLAMLTLAFAQIVWALVFQWEALTGGSNGVIGVWPPPPFDRAWVYFLLSLVLAAIGVLMLRRFLFAPFGYAMRAGRDSPLRAEAIGIDVKRVHWLGFAIAGAVCGVAGGLFAFAKGSISPETIHVGRSIDGLVMVLLGGIQTLTGPIVGASVFATLQDTVMRQTEYWRALLGIIILLLVLAFPQGIVGAFSSIWRKAGAKP